MPYIKPPYEFSLDLKSKVGIPPITIIKDDTKTNIFNITINSYGQPIDLTGSTVTITFKKEDGNVVIGNCTVIDALKGIVSYTLGSSEAAYLGNVTFSCEVYGLDGMRASTFPAKFKVVGDLDDGTGIPSSTEYPILTELISNVEALEGDIEEAESSRVSAENNRVSEFNKIKSDYNVASNYTVINQSWGTYTATEDNTTTFILPSDVFNPVVDCAWLSYRGVPLIKGKHYTQIGSEITLLFSINDEEEIDYRIDKGVINEVPGADGSMLMNGSVTQPKLSQDVQDKLDLAATFNSQLEGIAETKARSARPLRVLLISDIHYDSIKSYDTYTQVRFKWIVDLINAENQKDPVDYVIFGGDLVSYDFTVIDCVAKEFFPRINVPYFVVPGNHDYFTNDKWRELFGSDRQFTVIDDDYAFICCDTFDLSTYNIDNPGVVDYKGLDIDFLTGELNKIGSRKAVIVCHYFDWDNATEAEKAIIFDDRILCVYRGHTHNHKTIPITYNEKTKFIFETGVFRYSSGKYVDAYPDVMYSFRDLRISNGALKTRVIFPEYTYKDNGVTLATQTYHYEDETTLETVTNRDYASFYVDRSRILTPKLVGLNNYLEQGTYSLTKITAMNTGDNLNNYITPGIYSSMDMVMTATLLNCPLNDVVLNPEKQAGNFKLVVEALNTNYYTIIRQMLISGAYTYPVVFVRNYATDTKAFTPWNRLIDYNYAKNYFERIALVGTEDLNSITTTGRYFSASTTISTGILNKPKEQSYGFTLYVEQLATVTGTSLVKQLLRSYQNGNITTFERQMFNGTWGAWYRTSPLSLTTTARNALTTSNASLNPGDVVFDTTLNKPVWRNAANTGWIDATGNTV